MLDLLIYFLATVGLIVLTAVFFLTMQTVWNQIGGLKNYVSVAEREKKYVLITGCDSGFGYELACRLDKLGCNVFAACLTEDGMKNLNDHCTTRLKAIQMDVTKLDTIEAAYDIIKKLIQKQGLWGIVNNAGVSTYGGFIEWDTLEDMKWVCDVNIWGGVACIKTFLPLLKISKGRIVNISSMSGRLSVPGTTAYSISKYGMEALSDCLRLEMKSWDISVSAIEPGSHKTNLTKNIGEGMAKNWEGLSSEIKEEYGYEMFKEVLDLAMNNVVKRCSPNTYKVVDCMEHALFSINPKPRYYAGWDMALFISWLSLLPANVTDYIFAFLIGDKLTPKVVKDKRMKECELKIE